MAKQIIDLSGLGGLLERHQGDLNDVSAKPHLRYLGADGSFADGIFNPMKTYGYMSPANNTFTSLTGTLSAPINAINYDPESDTVFISEGGENILTLDGLDDTSVANYLTVSTGSTIKDSLIYEVNGQKSLIYVIDSNTPVINAIGNVSINAGGMYIGFKTLDIKEGLTLLDKDIRAGYPTIQNYAIAISDSASYSTRATLRKLAQEFTISDVPGRQISGASISMRRALGTGAGITIKVSIQGPASASAAPYTSRGAWVTATAYALNDTVTNVGKTYNCIVAHTSGSGTQPGVGGTWQTNWSIFGAPNGTDIVSGTFSLSDVPVYGQNGEERYNVAFSTTSGVLSYQNYWIVVEEVGTVMTSADQLKVRCSVNGTGIYSSYQFKGYKGTTGVWECMANNNDPTSETMDFRLILNRDDKWTSNRGSVTTGLSNAVGNFSADTGQESFLYLADDGITYWFVENHVHTVDGSSTGGFTGKVTEDVFVFPSYISVADVAETRSRMYMGIHMNKRVQVTDPRYYGSERIGVYVWDRRSQIQGSSDFYSCPGAKEIKSVFLSSDGTVKVITTSNSGFTEIRGINGNQYAVLHTFETNGYPSSRKGVSQINNMTVWLGANGIFYGYGSVTSSEKQQLYKLGTITSLTGAGLITGPVLVGNEYSSAPQSAVIFGWKDTPSGNKVSKWYPNGDGTINSNLQKPNQGDIYTKVYTLPSLSTLKYLRLMMAPGVATGTTTIANLKCYYNQSATAAWTKAITLDDIHKGWKNIEINKNNVNFIQFEIEYITSITLGDSDFKPMYIELEYADENRINP